MSDRMAGILDVIAQVLTPSSNPMPTVRPHPGDVADVSALQLVPDTASSFINDAARYGRQAVTGSVSDGELLNRPELQGDARTFSDALGDGFSKLMNYGGLLDGPSGADVIGGVVDAYQGAKPELIDALGESAVNRLEGAGLLASMVLPGRAGKAASLQQVDGILDAFTARQQPRQVETNFSTENVTDKKYLERVLDDLKVDAQRVQYDKPEIYLPDYYGKNAVITMVDRSPTNTQVFGVNGVEFKTPQQIGGGRDYMFDNENYSGLVFANDSGATQSILNRQAALSVDPDSPDDMLLIPMEMATTSVDFPDFAPGLHTRYAQAAMSAKDKKYVNDLIQKGGDGKLSDALEPTAVPGFDIDMEDLDAFLFGLSGPQRKTINNVFDMVNRPSPAQKKKGARQVEGALSNDEMRATVSDPDLYNQESLLQTNNVGVITGGKFPSNHNTYDTGLGGEGLGILNIPRDTPATAPDFLPELFPNSTPEFVDPSEAFTARRGVRTAEINDGLLKRLGY